MDVIDQVSEYNIQWSRMMSSEHVVRRPPECPEALGVSFDVVDGLRGVVGRSQSGDDALAGGGGGADAAASDVEVLLM